VAATAPFQTACKMKALTAYSTRSSYSIPFDEMAVLDIGRLPDDGGDDEEGTKAVSGVRRRFSLMRSSFGY
jgi:hypothetical protein